jgi:hypothetical protein
MRILPAALALSVVIHGVALAVVVTRNPAQPLANPPVDNVEVVDVQPMAVALLDDHTVASVPPLAATPAASVNGPATRIAATAGHRGGEVASDGQPVHSTLMDMRRPERPPERELKGPSDEFMRKFLGKPVVAQPNPIEGERITDELEDTDHNLHDESWMSHASGEQQVAERERRLALEDARDSHELKQDGDGYKATHSGFVANVEADGTAHIHDKPTFDATDAAMRHFHDDPYASNKRKFLDDTREERYEIGKRYKHQQLQHSAILAKQNVDWLWAKTRDAGERKQGLFEMWDDCAETGDDDLVTGGRAARNVIVGFIRAHMTGADAYTPDEVAAFNAHRHSVATFAPYTD